MIAGWASNALTFIAAGFIALGIYAWIRGETTHESRPFHDDREDRG